MIIPPLIRLLWFSRKFIFSQENATVPSFTNHNSELSFPATIILCKNSSIWNCTVLPNLSRRAAQAWLQQMRNSHFPYLAGPTTTLSSPLLLLQSACSIALERPCYGHLMERLLVRIHQVNVKLQKTNLSGHCSVDQTIYNNFKYYNQSISTTGHRYNVPSMSHLNTTQFETLFSHLYPTTFSTYILWASVRHVQKRETIVCSARVGHASKKTLNDYSKRLCDHVRNDFYQHHSKARWKVHDALKI